jgi:uncharacterized protein (DUF488 family)
MAKVYTIGFTKKTAAKFFGALTQAGIRRLVDIRLNSVSQLAGFAKQTDLPYFLKMICDAEYVHEPLLTPPKDLLAAYRKKSVRWEEFERAFIEVLAERRVEVRIKRKLFAGPSVLLCSEAEPVHCHRRLVAEYLRLKWGGLDIVHLL